MKKTQLDKLIKEEVDKALMNEMIEDEINDRIKNLSTDEYENFSDEHGIDPEDGEEMANFIGAMSTWEVENTIDNIKKGYYKHDQYFSRN